VLGKAAEVVTAWEETEEFLETGTGLVVVERFLTDGSIQTLSAVKGDHPLARLAVVCHCGARNVDAMARAQFVPHRFLGIDQIHMQLPRLVREFSAASPRDLLVEVLEPYCQFTDTRLVVRFVFLSDTLPRLDPELASALGMEQNRLRRVKNDLGQSAHELIRWSRLIRAVELRRAGVREPELSHSLGIADTALREAARAFLGMTFRNAAQRGAQFTAGRLLAAVRQHRGDRSHKP
jgi:hypothetical protein